MILITGVSGLLGINLLTRARERKLDAAGFYYSHAVDVPNTVTMQVDLRDAASMRAVVHDLRPSAIIHCAAATNIDWCEDHPGETERINVHTPFYLAEIAADIGAHFTFVSTDSVFDGSRGNYSERDEPRPLNVYAKTKLSAETEVRRANPDSLVARLTIYGCNSLPKRSLAEWILGRLAEGREVPGFTDVIFSPILANDVADALLEILKLKLKGLYHIAGSEAVSKFEFARALARTFDLDLQLVVPASLDAARLIAHRPKNTSLDTEKIEGALDVEMPDVETGLRRFKAMQDSGYALELRSYVAGAMV